VAGWFGEDVARRFEAYGWHVVRDVDGHDAAQVKAALETARAETARPSLVVCKTVIGWGAPNKQGTHDSHGAPLGAAEVAATRERIGWKHEAFVIPDEYYRGWDARRRGAELEAEWRARFDAYRRQHPELATEFERRVRGDLPAGWPEHAARCIAEIAARAETMATRKASQAALDAYGPILPELIGGSADLTWSNLTLWKGSRPIGPGQSDGNYIYYGVREFGMAAINNGIALHGGFIPYGGTFLIFSDYARNALRMAALMKQRCIYVLTHDSIGLGEDGPTHQAVEQAASLRLIPNMSVWRPCDGVETAVAWKAAIERRHGPTCLLLSRQNLKAAERSVRQIEDIARGGYVLADGGARPEAVIIATGSEIELALAAVAKLKESGRRIRLVSMPCTDVFDAQDRDWRDAVLPPGCPRVAVEAGVPDCWRKYVGLEGGVLGVPRFGASAPGPDVYRHVGLTAERLIELVESIIRT
jgi:transketolase